MQAEEQKCIFGDIADENKNETAFMVGMEKEYNMIER